MNGVIMTWEGIEEEPHAVSASIKFRLVMLEGTRSVVRVVPEDEFLEIIENQNSRKIYVRTLAGSTYVMTSNSSMLLAFTS